MADRRTGLAEARRYVENARKILSEQAEKRDGYYQDPKYVKLAGHAAYLGVLAALDELFGKKVKGRKSIEWYTEQLAGLDRRKLDELRSAYNILHLYMSYDGEQKASISTEGLELADVIIDWVAQRKGEA